MNQDPNDGFQTQGRGKKKSSPQQQQQQQTEPDKETPLLLDVSLLGSIPCIRVKIHVDGLTHQRLPPSRDLVRAIQLLFDWIDTRPELLSAYRVELTGESDGWLVSLLFHPVAWYDFLLPAETRVAVAREYVRVMWTRVRSRSPRGDPEKCRPTDDYCFRPNDCWRSVKDSRCASGRHAKIYCTEKNVQRRNATTADCNWFVRDELVLHSLAPEKYVAYARPAPVRDIILAPKKHTSNRKLACQTEFWDAAATFLGSIREYHAEYTIEKLALNFGTWESLQGEDPNALDCHAHVHFYISRATATRLKEKILRGAPSYEKVMEGRTGPPEDYTEANILALETQRLICDEANQNHERLRGIESRMTGLESRMTGLESRMDKMDSRMSGMESRMDKFELQMTHLTSLVETVLSRLPEKKQSSDS